MTNFAMPVRLYMTSPVVSTRPEASLEEARALLRGHRISSLAVLDPESKLLGVLSRTDLLREGRFQTGARPEAPLLALPAKEVGQVMTGEPITCEADSPLEVAADLMTRNRVHRIFVVEEDRVTGVLSTRDLMAAIREKKMNQPISEFLTSPVFTIRAHEPISEATDRLAKAGVSGLVVVEDGWPVGIFTQEEALAAQRLDSDTAAEDAMGHALLILGSETKMHRAAAQAEALRARRVVAMDDGKIVGILTGLDFARAVAG